MISSPSVPSPPDSASGNHSIAINPWDVYVAQCANVTTVSSKVVGQCKMLDQLTYYLMKFVMIGMSEDLTTTGNEQVDTTAIQAAREALQKGQDLSSGEIHQLAILDKIRKILPVMDSYYHLIRIFMDKVLFPPASVTSPPASSAQRFRNFFKFDPDSRHRHGGNAKGGLSMCRTLEELGYDVSSVTTRGSPMFRCKVDETAPQTPGTPSSSASTPGNKNTAKCSKNKSTKKKQKASASPHVTIVSPLTPANSFHHTTTVSKDQHKSVFSSSIPMVRALPPVPRFVTTTDSPMSTAVSSSPAYFSSSTVSSVARPAERNAVLTTAEADAVLGMIARQSPFTREVIGVDAEEGIPEGRSLPKLKIRSAPVETTPMDMPETLLEPTLPFFDTEATMTQFPDSTFYNGMGDSYGQFGYIGGMPLRSICSAPSSPFKDPLTNPLNMSAICEFEKLVAEHNASQELTFKRKEATPEEMPSAVTSTEVIAQKVGRFIDEEDEAIIPD